MRQPNIGDEVIVVGDDGTGDNLIGETAKVDDTSSEQTGRTYRVVADDKVRVAFLRRHQFILRK